MEKYKARSRWTRMLSRCEDEDNPQYGDYGGRGIYVCAEWHDFHKFYGWACSNGMTTSLQLDRTNNDGPYSPENCTFISRSGNARNKRSTVWLDAWGEKKSMAEWSKDTRCLVSYVALAARIRRGWSAADAMTVPPDASRKNKTPHNVHSLTAFGETKTVSEWLKDERCKVNAKIIWQRRRAGWSDERAMS